MKYVWLLIGAALTYWIVKNKQSSNNYPFNTAKNNDFSNKNQSEQSTQQLIVSCANCGLHLPEKDAQQVAGSWYCCAEHAKHGKPQTH